MQFQNSRNLMYIYKSSKNLLKQLISLYIYLIVASNPYIKSRRKLHYLEFIPIDT